MNDTSHNSEIDALLCCEKCGNELGIADDAVSGWKIYKWSIRLRKDAQSEPRAFSAQKWIASLLLSSSENTGVRRFVVEPSSPIAKSNTLPPSILVSLQFSSPRNSSQITQTALAFHTRSLLLLLLPTIFKNIITKRPDTRHQSL